MKKLLLFTFLFLTGLGISGQGFNIPTNRYFLGFGNTKNFSGIRFNFIDKNIDKINGINVTIWNARNDSEISGTINGISIGLPMAYGSADRNGISLAIFGVGARDDINGINIAGLGVGSGGDVNGINISGLATGSGNDMNGINIGGLAVGGGRDVKGINWGGLAAGAGGDLQGITFGGIAAGAGQDVQGISIGGIAVGAGRDLTGLSIGGVGLGAGRDVMGINISGIGMGAGRKLVGLNIAGVAIGAPNINGFSMAPIIGGNYVQGLNVAPLYFTIRSDQEKLGIQKGVAISSFNHIRGEQRGLTIGILNIADHLEGVQIGLINIARSNRKGLKVLPLFNGPFH